eukprot:CAMPEP_0171067360 /NCGR_PEP_ID=MMETSP0766_2-20121228/7957_1 /TAXON_ID=439317 /ORGANISM="Gambierdiscus australes, Strain CAWD 149" /LENGTH=86 /DNA_ID=CAMNT_0011523597 /DNA_START=42 /DNA_END=299 /DNA_ORIENTATION=+
MPDGPRRGHVPTLDVALAPNELQVVRALRVAVAGAVLGPCLVRARAKATVGFHLDKVHRSVETALQRGHIHVEAELTVQQLEHHVG